MKKTIEVLEKSLNEWHNYFKRIPGSLPYDTQRKTTNDKIDALTHAIAVLKRCDDEQGMANLLSDKFPMLNVRAHPIVLTRELSKYLKEGQ